MSDETNGADLAPDRVTAIFHRIKQRRIPQWMIGYVAVAYGIQHAVNLTAEAFDWPHIVTRISMLLLALGVPLAMVFAWYRGERTTRLSAHGPCRVGSGPHPPLLVLGAVMLVCTALTLVLGQIIGRQIADAQITPAHA